MKNKRPELARHPAETKPNDDTADHIATCRIPQSGTRRQMLLEGLGRLITLCIAISAELRADAVTDSMLRAKDHLNRRRR